MSYRRMRKQDLWEIYRRRQAAVELHRFYGIVESLLPARTQKPAPGVEQLLRHKEELRELINRKKEPLKPKTAFTVVRTKYRLTVSYATFKRFARQQGLSRPQRRAMIRIELSPGLETQLDYGKVGTLHDTVTGTNRVVWAFCGVLAFSRLPYV